MKITAVEAYLLSVPLPGSGMKRDAMLIRVSTSEGIFGYAPGEPTASSKRLIDRLIAPFLTGRSLTDPDALYFCFNFPNSRFPATLYLQCPSIPTNCRRTHKHCARSCSI